MFECECEPGWTSASQFTLSFLCLIAKRCKLVKKIKRFFEWFGKQKKRSIWLQSQVLICKKFKILILSDPDNPYNEFLHTIFTACSFCVLAGCCWCWCSCTARRGRTRTTTRTSTGRSSRPLSYSARSTRRSVKKHLSKERFLKILLDSFRDAFIAVLFDRWAEVMLKQDIFWEPCSVEDLEKF